MLGTGSLRMDKIHFFLQSGEPQRKLLLFDIGHPANCRRLDKMTCFDFDFA